MRPGIRVFVYYRQPRDSSGDVVLAYHAACGTLAGTPGLVGHELLGLLGDDGSYALLMLWRELADFQAWERDLRAGGHPSPLREFQDRARPGGHYEIYEVRAGGAPAHLP